MLSGDSQSHAPMRCNSLLPQVLHVYLSVKHSQWSLIMDRIKNEARFKCGLEDTNEHWGRALEVVTQLLHKLGTCLWEESAGERCGRAHRLCIVDRAERCAQAAVESARLQGRTESRHFRMLTFIYAKSTMFYVNAMIAHKHGDNLLQGVWCEAGQLIESKAFAARGHEGLLEACDFPPNSTSHEINLRRNTRRWVDSSARNGAPCKNALPFRKLVWAYEIVDQIHRRIHLKTRNLQYSGFMDPYEEDPAPRSEHAVKAYRAALVADLYNQSANVLASAELEYMEWLRPLARRAGDILHIAADGRAAELATFSHAAPPSCLESNAEHLQTIAKQLEEWHQACLDTISAMNLSEEESKELVSVQRADADEAVREVVASDLYKSPETAQSAWANAHRAKFFLLIENVKLLARTMREKLGRRAYYLERSREIDAALSPAHEKIRRCWEKAAVVLDPPKGDNEDSLRVQVHCCGKLFVISSKLAIWLAISYAHLADGLYADAADYYLRASQTAASGDKGQAKCWKTAAERLVQAADLDFDNLGLLTVSPVSKTATFTSVLPATDLGHLRWARCGQVLSRLHAAGGTASDGTKLGRALIRLIEELERLSHKQAPPVAPTRFGYVHQEPPRKSVPTLISEFLEEIWSAATAVHEGGSDMLPSAQRFALFTKVAAVAMELCEKRREIWRWNIRDIPGDPPDYIEECTERATVGLASAVAAINAGSVQGMEEGYLEAAQQNEKAAAIIERTRLALGVPPSAGRR